MLQNFNGVAQQWLYYLEVIAVFITPQSIEKL